jgi:hypothetical protein
VVNYVPGRDLAVTGTWYQREDIHKVTWRTSVNKICNQIDDVSVGARHCTNVCDVRSVSGVDIESDHLGTILANKIKLKPEIIQPENFAQPPL